MSLDTFSGLKGELADWLRRDDLTSRIPSFIVLCEAQLNRRLKTLDMTVRAEAALDEEFVDVPGDFRGVKAFSFEGGHALEYRSPEQMTELVAVQARTGKPELYTVEGRQFRFYPAPDTEYTADLTYWQKVPLLSDAAPTNWLLTDHPDIYLYGSLMSASLFLKNDERVPMWAQAFETAMSDLTAASRSDETGAVLRAIPSTVV